MHSTAPLSLHPASRLSSDTRLEVLLDQDIYPHATSSWDRQSNSRHTKCIRRDRQVSHGRSQSGGAAAVQECFRPSVSDMAELKRTERRNWTNLVPNPKSNRYRKRQSFQCWKAVATIFNQSMVLESTHNKRSIMYHKEKSRLSWQLHRQYTTLWCTSTASYVGRNNAQHAKIHHSSKQRIVCS